MSIGTIQQDIANNFPSSLCIAPEGELSDDEEMPGIYFDGEEEGNPKSAAQALILGINFQADAIDGYVQFKFYKKVNAVQNCSDADCVFTVVYTANDLRWQQIYYML